MVRRAPGAMLVAGGIAMLLLAGCTSPAAQVVVVAPHSLFYRGATELQAGRFYAFHHEGGDLAFGSGFGSSARFQLFDRDDVSVGEYNFSGAGATDLHLSLAAGDLVLRFDELEGAITIESGGIPADLVPLNGHVERIILAQEQRNPLPSLPLFPLQGDSVPIELNLTRTPTLLRLLADGSFGALRLNLTGTGGEVFLVEAGGLTTFPLFNGGLAEVPGSFNKNNVRDGRLAGNLDVEDLSGALILEAFSFSRATPPGQALVGSQPGPPRFTYGLLPELPVEFQVEPATRTLVFWEEDSWAPPAMQAPEPSGWVAIYDPHDQKLASVPILPGSFSTLAVKEAGAYVAIRLSGNVTLGADHASPTLGLRPLSVQKLELPSRAAGGGGDYGQANGSVQPAGALFDVWPTMLDDPVDFPMFTCSPEPSLRILQGETLAAWGPTWESGPTSAGVLLASGSVELWHDGFGPSGCARLGAAFLSYER